jgi:outer membrane biosynthesis protein TonB
MRTASFALVALAVGLASFVACGGSTPPAQVATPPGAPVVDTTAPRAVGDAGATSTTTDTLGGTGAGTKLTPLASGDAGTDPAHPKHHTELGRSVADIQAILGSHRDEARACYDNALAAHPGIEGNLDVRWTIDPAGNVTDAELDTSRSEIVEPAVATCVIAVVKKIHFNASAKGFETKAHYPWNFHPHTHHAVMGTP